MNDEGTQSLFGRLPDEEAREELVAQFAPLARHLAHRYSNRGLDHEDLEQVAYVGLLNAIDRYDPDYGSRFVSFAVPTITGELKRHFRDLGWGTGVTRRMKELRGLCRQAEEELSQRLGRSPTLDEIAEHIEVSTDEVAEAAALGTAYRPDTLDGPPVDQARARISTVGDVEGRFDLIEDLDAIEPVIRKQSDREKEILRLRFYEDLTQREIAEKIGISQMHVSRILNGCLAKIRILLG